MRIGLKLDIDFASAASYAELFGQKDILNCILAAGVRQAEAPLGPETQTGRLSAFATAVSEAGLYISLHPYSERSIFNPAAFEEGPRNRCLIFHDRMFRVADSLAQLRDRPVTVNIHPAGESARFERTILLERSMRFFSWAVSHCTLACPGAVPVAELQIAPNPGEDIIRIGDRFDELGLISEASGCGLCWDFGHAWLNRMRYEYPDEPPPELLKKIVHVHCHDVNIEDHKPLIYNSVPWQRYLSLLKAEGFSGTVILEVPPQSFINAGGIATFTRSVEALKGISKHL